MKGFTLIELLLYVAVISIFFLAIVPFAWTAIGTASKSSTQQEVYGSARFISEKIKLEIRNAKGINNISAGSISLSQFVSAKDPTVISSTGGNVTIQQGTDPAVNLNPTGVTISSLIFTNNSSPDNKTKNITYDLTVISSLGNSRQEFQATSQIRGSAEVRSN